MNKENIQKVIDALESCQKSSTYYIFNEDEINKALLIMQEELDKPEIEPAGQVGKTFVVNWFNKQNPGAYIYAEPPASQKQKPLSDDEIVELTKTYHRVTINSFPVEINTKDHDIELARAIERAHGII